MQSVVLPISSRPFFVQFGQSFSGLPTSGLPFSFFAPLILYTVQQPEALIIRRCGGVYFGQAASH